MHMENLDRFGPCQIILDHFYTLGFFGPFGPFWTVLDHFGPFWTVWTILDRFGPFWTVWTILDRFGPFWTVWTVLDRLDHFGPFEPFCTTETDGRTDGWMILINIVPVERMIFSCTCSWGPHSRKLVYMESRADTLATFSMLDRFSGLVGSISRIRSPRLK